jgi:hypothetical protein
LGRKLLRSAYRLGGLPAGDRSNWIGDMGVTASALFCIFSIVVLYLAIVAEEKRQREITQSSRLAARIHKYPLFKFPKHPAP